MKNSKLCDATGSCWGHRHELLGIILIILATILTIYTWSGIGIAVMFIVGALLCCYKCFSCHCGHCCDSKDGHHKMGHHDEGCHTDSGEIDSVRKAKAKPKA